MLSKARWRCQVLREWLAAGCAPGLAESVVDLCGEQLLAIKALLRRWRIASWDRPHLVLMHALVGLLGLLAERAQASMLLGCWLLAVLLEPEDCLALVRSYTRNALFSSGDKGPPGIKELPMDELLGMQQTGLRYWAALVRNRGTKWRFCRFSPSLVLSPP